MYRKCETCGRGYNDEGQNTICPHPPLGFAPASFCPKCDTLKEFHGACGHQSAAPVQGDPVEIYAHFAAGANLAGVIRFDQEEGPPIDIKIGELLTALNNPEKPLAGAHPADIACELRRQGLKFNISSGTSGLSDVISTDGTARYEPGPLRQVDSCALANELKRRGWDYDPQDFGRFVVAENRKKRAERFAAPAAMMAHRTTAEALGTSPQGGAEPDPMGSTRESAEAPIFEMLNEAAAKIDRQFADGLRELINRFSIENGSNTPDRVLANFLIGCLEAFEAAVVARDEFYSFDPQAMTLRGVNIGGRGPGLGVPAGILAGADPSNYAQARASYENFFGPGSYDQLTAGKRQSVEFDLLNEVLEHSGVSVSFHANAVTVIKVGGGVVSSGNMINTDEVLQQALRLLEAGFEPMNQEAAPEFPKYVFPADVRDDAQLIFKRRGGLDSVVITIADVQAWHNHFANGVTGSNGFMPSKERNPNGLHQRYRVSRLEGPTDPKAVYFVLRLDRFGRDPVHVKACRVAARAYAGAVEGSHLQQVGQDLRSLVIGLANTPLEWSYLPDLTAWYARTGRAETCWMIRIIGVGGLFYVAPFEFAQLKGDEVSWIFQQDCPGFPSLEAAKDFVSRKELEALQAEANPPAAVIIGGEPLAEGEVVSMAGGRPKPILTTEHVQTDGPGAGVWTVYKRGNRIMIADDRGRERHSSEGHAKTATFLAGELSRREFRCQEGSAVETALKTRVAEFIAGD